MSQYARRMALCVLCAMAMLAGCGDDGPQPVHETVMCRSPAGDRTAKHILKWKFDTVRESVLAVLPASGDIARDDLITAVESGYSEAMKDSLGDVRDCIQTVMLELEVREEIERVHGSSETPSDRIRRASPK